MEIVQHILLLDTSTSVTMLALAEKKPGQPYNLSYRWQESPLENTASASQAPRRHSTTLLSLIEKALSERGLEFAQLTALGVCIGPGSFTGLRVGLACVKTMAQVLDLPIYPFDRFQLLVAAFAPENAYTPQNYTVQIQAQRGLSYHAILGKLHQTASPHLCDLNNCPYQEMLPPNAVTVSEQAIFSPEAMLDLLPLTTPCTWKMLEPLYIQEPNITLRRPLL